MSRIGKAPIAIPAGVTVTVSGDTVTVKGPKGTLTQKFNPEIDVKVENNEVVLTRPSDDREHRSQHGLYRALIHNMVVGVSEGYRKEMELVGVGYRAAATGQVLELALGYSHAIYLKLPPEVKVEAKSERNKNPLIISRATTSSSSVRYALKSAASASPSPIKAKVSSLSVKLSAANLANRQAPSNKYHSPYHIELILCFPRYNAATRSRPASAAASQAPQHVRA
mgnify:CR=1 FL=1